MSWFKDNWINVLMLLIIIVAGIKVYTPEPITDEGSYDYCVQWGVFDRSDLVWHCYNFVKQRINCDWYEKGNILVIHEYGNQSNVLAEMECSRYVKSIVNVSTTMAQLEDLSALKEAFD